jgi:carbamoyl-phosphate synthase small subunit
MKTATLALENGQTFEGVSIGADGETTGEVVFNTSLTGYQEVLTDPSYSGQIVTMTAPQIGNYGVTAEDCESRRRRWPASSSARRRRCRRTGAPRTASRTT